MSSKYEQIQKMYDEIENVQQILLKEEQNEDAVSSKHTNLSAIFWFIKKD